MRRLKLKLLLSRYSYGWLPLLILFALLQMNYSLWVNEKRDADKAIALKYEYTAREAGSAINKEMGAFQQAILGIQSFYRASNYVTESEFNRYVSNILQQQRNIGLRSIGFARYVDTSQPDSYADLGVDFQQWVINSQPHLHKQTYAPIVYLAPKPLDTPITQWNAFAQPERKLAMHRAMQQHDFIMSGRASSDELGQVCECFTIHYPVYLNGASVNGATERQQHIYGWIFFRVSIADFLKSTLTTLEDGNVQFAVFDVTGTTSTQPFYQTAVTAQRARVMPPKFSKELRMEMMQYLWRIEASSTPAFEAVSQDSRANQMGLLGLLASLVFSGAIYLGAMRLRDLQMMNKVSQKLHMSEQRWQFALEGAGDGVWDWDIEKNSVIFSKRWKAMLGYEESEIENSIDEWKSRVHPEDFPSVMNALNHALDGSKETYAHEYRMRCKDGTWKWILDRGMVVSRNKQGYPVRMVGTHADISDLKQSEETIWQHANFDSLTGLPNRRMFYARLDQEIQKAKRSGLKVALIFLDLDGFKEVNDTLGHDQGDLLLKLAANRLGECMRGSDAVARLGGDEFILIISDVVNAELGRVEAVAQKVIDTLTEPFQLSHEIAYITASLGIVIYPDDAMRIEDLMKSVDQAMYASKQKGGGCFTYFTPRMQEVAQHRKQLSNDLRLALSRGELFLEYQPIVDLSSGEIYKAEALLRWQHPTRGLIKPAEFIPVAEDTRLIYDIGNWVFEHAMQQAMAWRERLHPNFQITVNKSPMQFQYEGAKQSTWVDFMQVQHIPGDAVIVEITESLLLDASSKVKDRLALFQQLGIQVAIDDFGTGYSSLSYLKKFDIDYLKIDQSFVANLAEQSEDLILCEAIIVMAHRLGIKVIAEGIENDLQKTLLARAGCDFGQGYYYAASVSAEVFESVIKGAQLRSATR